jgi:tRNA threonylcarbamoyladenosine biosynthesis protein TsaE
MLRHTMERTGLSEPRLVAAARALGARLRGGDVVLLCGPMGAGKTTFTRALAEGLGVLRPDRVRSPTFNLWLEHPGPRPLAHVDLFRLAADDDDPAPGSVGAAAFEALGLSELADQRPAAGGSTPVLVVEWGELWADPPAAALRIELRPDPANSAHRTLIATATGDRPTAVLAAWERVLLPSTAP